MFTECFKQRLYKYNRIETFVITANHITDRRFIKITNVTKKNEITLNKILHTSINVFVALNDLLKKNSIKLKDEPYNI